MVRRADQFLNFRRSVNLICFRFIRPKRFEVESAEIDLRRIPFSVPCLGQYPE
jgi:hypothetical protein